MHPHQQNHGPPHQGHQDGGAQVRLFDNKGRGDEDQRQGEQQVLDMQRPLGGQPVEVPGQHQNERYLDQFRGLQGDGSQRQPALGAGDRLAPNMTAISSTILRK
jgi:hypothetical protein